MHMIRGARKTLIFLNVSCKSRSASFKCESRIRPKSAGVSPFFPCHFAGNGGLRSLASRNEGGPECVVAPGPIFLRNDPASILVEQRSELLDQGSAKLFSIHDRHCTGIVASNIVADANRRQLDARAALDPADDLAQMPL